MSHRPNLFIVGAMKSGTSSLHDYLGAHPQVFMCSPKEPCYFADPSELRWSSIYNLGLRRGEQYYLNLFESAGEAEIIGESSTLYTKAPRYSGIPERIARFNPNARIIYIMRDPVERTISHYWHTVIHDGETREMLEAIRQDEHYREVSYYAMQLRTYLELFGPERVLALTFERLVADPIATTQHIFAWLGVDSSFIPTNLDDRCNVTPRQIAQARGRGWLRRFRYGGIWTSVGPYVPRTVRQWGRRLADQPVDRAQQSTDQVVAYLQPIQREQVRELSELLCCRFDDWSTLFGRKLTTATVGTKDT